MQARRREHGANQIATEQQHRFVPDLLGRLRNPLNLMLLSLAALSGLIRDWQAASVITCMVALSVGLATWQESRSGKAAAALRAMVHTVIAVRRRPAAGAQTQTSNIPIAELVPGDVIHLAAGDLVPADVRLLAAKDLFVNQAALTGESHREPGQPGVAGGHRRHMRAGRVAAVFAGRGCTPFA